MPVYDYSHDRSLIEVLTENAGGSPDELAAAVRSWITQSGNTRLEELITTAVETVEILAERHQVKLAAMWTSYQFWETIIKALRRKMAEQ